MEEHVGSYLKRHTEALVKDVGLEAACAATGRSKATLGRYYSHLPEHADRFMPVDAVARLEAIASHPHVTSALAELRGLLVADRRESAANRRGSVNTSVVLLSQRFAQLMAEYNQAIDDGVITLNEARRLLAEVLELQRVLVEMKQRLEREAGAADAAE